MTHGHPSGQLPAGVFTPIIRKLADGDRLLVAIAKSIDELKDYPDHQETLEALEFALALATNDKISHTDAISRLGEGWVAEEASAIAVYCVIVAKDFCEGVLMAVNHDGDPDSTGSIAGNMLGLIHGLNDIPPNWLDNLELREVISDIAEDLHNTPNWKTSCYPGHNDDDWIWKNILVVEMP